MRLIDADAMMEKYNDWYTEDGEPNGVICTVGCLLRKEPTVGGWISVKDRLPEHMDRVPVLYRFTDSELQDGKLHTAMLWYVREPFCGDEPPHWERVGRYEYEVLYWFELPGAPEEVRG